MSYGYRLTLTQTLTSATESIFPAVEILLRETEYQKALEYVSSRKDMNPYHDMVDFLHAELYGGWIKRACFKYYEGNGCLFKDNPRVTVEMIAEQEKEILKALEIAYIQMNEERERSWKQFVKQWKRAA